MNVESPSPIVGVKRKLREELLARRKAIPEEERERVALSIRERLIGLISPDRLVMAYSPVRGEVDPMPFVRSIWERGGEVAFPVVIKGQGLIARKAADASQLALAPFGLREPPPSCPAVDPLEIGAVLVPALAYDRRGYRLGYGGGYYDRFLPLLGPSVVSVGLAYEALLVDRLPIESHDRPVRWVLTEDQSLGPFGREEELG